MEPRVAARLLDLNRRFYREFGQAYAEKRGFLQPGVQRLLLQRVPREARLLDVGCGHGRVLEMLQAQGFQGTYIGLDASPPLLEAARQRADRVDFTVRLLHRDLASPTWHEGVPEVDAALCFAVLHHLPGWDLRLRVLRTVHGLLAPRGWMALSVWNLLRSPRLKARVQPWETVGLTGQDVDSGDLLVDWRHGGYGLRYIHQFTLPELEALLSAAGFHLRETFLSDGEGGRLGIYVVGEK